MVGPRSISSGMVIHIPPETSKPSVGSVDMTYYPDSNRLVMGAEEPSKNGTQLTTTLLLKPENHIVKAFAETGSLTLDDYSRGVSEAESVKVLGAGTTLAGVSSVRVDISYDDALLFEEIPAGTIREPEELFNEPKNVYTKETARQFGASALPKIRAAVKEVCVLRG